MGVLKRGRGYIPWIAHADIVTNDDASQHIVVRDVGNVMEELLVDIALAHRSHHMCGHRDVRQTACRFALPQTQTCVHEFVYFTWYEHLEGIDLWRPPCGLRVQYEPYSSRMLTG